jgi:hypothetical protein
MTTHLYQLKRRKIIRSFQTKNQYQIGYLIKNEEQTSGMKSLFSSSKRREISNHVESK